MYQKYLESPYFSQVTHRYFLLRTTNEDDGGLRLKWNFSNAFICFETGVVYSLATML
jgi:hypothetical protein